MEIFGILWQEVIMRPMINSLALLYQILFSNFGLSIIVFTILIRLAMIPLTVRQTRQMKKMQSIQPKLKAIQNKYKGKKGDDRRKMSSETMGLYKDAGVSPVGCLGPMIIQMPIWIGFYRAILRTMPSTPKVWRTFRVCSTTGTRQYPRFHSIVISWVYRLWISFLLRQCRGTTHCQYW